MTKKILVVDDERDMVEVITASLIAHGYAVIPSYNGEDALALIKKDPPDLIILDIMLPNMNGHQVCRLLKFDAKYKKIPIIMLTAKKENEYKEYAEATKADAYFTKPFEHDSLLDKIKELLAE